MSAPLPSDDPAGYILSAWADVAEEACFLRSERLYSVAEVATYLQVHPGTVRRWIASGALPTVRPGPRMVRVRHRDLLDMIGVPAPATRS